MSGMITRAEALVLNDLIRMPDHGIASRVLMKSPGANVTLFAFDAGEGLSEHQTDCDALACVLEGALTITIDGVSVAAPAGTITRLPARVPHAVDAAAQARMLLIMLRGADQQKPQGL